MPETPIPIGNLPAVSEIDDNILFPVDQSGTAKKLSYANLAERFNNGSNGLTVMVDKTGTGSDVASMGADEVFEYAQNGELVMLIVKTEADTYVEAALSSVNVSGSNYTAYFCQNIGETEATKIWALDENKNVYVSSQYNFYSAGDTLTINDPNRIKLNYAPSIGEDAANKDYVDWAVYNSGDAGKVVVLEKDQNEQVFNGEEPIKGSQINALAESSKAVFLYDSDNERFYTYSVSDATGGAVFCRPERDSVYYETVDATTNTATFSISSYLPNVTVLDDGKVMGVVDGAWNKMDIMATISALENRIEALENQSNV